MKQIFISLPETWLIKLVIILAITGLIGILEFLIWIAAKLTDQAYHLFGLY